MSIDSSLYYRRCTHLTSYNRTRVRNLDPTRHYRGGQPYNVRGGTPSKQNILLTRRSASLIIENSLSIIEKVAIFSIIEKSARNARYLDYRIISMVEVSCISCTFINYRLSIKVQEMHDTSTIEINQWSRYRAFPSFF